MKKIMLSLVFCTGFLSPVHAKLVELKNLCPDIVLDMRYATTNNFMKQKIYPSARCFLERDVAQAIVLVQEDVKLLGLRLKIFDAYRPVACQKILWAIMPDERYVAHPAKGSRHNRGSAVDITLVDKHGVELPMGAEFDEFTERSHRNFKGLTPEARKNRKTLDFYMIKHGFIGLPNEWWHFDFAGWEKYPLSDMSFDDLE